MIENVTITRDQRIAIGEVIRVIALLAEAKSTHAKALAILVAGRIKVLAEGGAVDLAEDYEIDAFSRLSEAAGVRH